MIEQWQDFIYYNDNALSKEQVADMISHFEKNGESIDTYRSGTISDGGILPSTATHRQDYVYFLSSQSNPMEHLQWVNETIEQCLNEYLEKYPFLNDGRQVSWRHLKWHTVEKHGGYHAWHYENSAASHAQREVVWMIYLNDLEEDGGGETEFMYQLKRIRPTKGTVVIFRAGYTHVHKGNMVLKGDKYILTGWYIKTHLN